VIPLSSPDTDSDTDALVQGDEAVVVATDGQRDAVVDALIDALGDGLVESHVEPGVDLWVRVDVAAWVETAQVLRDRCAMSYFNFLSAVDWMPSPYGRDMDAQVDLSVETSGDEDAPADVTSLETGIAGGETRFQLLARVHDPLGHLGVTVKADLVGDAPEVDSWTGVYPGANWHEREAWEMFGISFRNHPNQIHLYLPSHFEGNPLRKDYPLLARRVKPWPGIVDVELMPDGDDTDEAVEDES
jgi:NADH-quinone oxidoreductase subunit C